MLPGVTVTSTASPPASSSEVESGTWFVAGLTASGPVDRAVLVRNMAQYEATFGERESNTVMWDSAETFFREGGSRLYVSRVAGPNPVVATRVLDDDAAADSLRVNALGPGAYGNDLDVVVTGSGPFVISIQDVDGVTVETSPSLADNDEAVAWSEGSAYIRLIDLGGDIPAVGDFGLQNGTDDRSNATDATWVAALDRFTKDLGPGQVSVPGRTSAQGQSDLLDHAEEFNRIALVDFVDTATEGTLISAAATLRAKAQARYGGGFAPWATIPGLTPGTERTVPYSAVQAGLIARLHSAGYNPNIAAAGVRGVARFATGLSQVAWTDVEREQLNDAGVNVAIVKDGNVRTYGYRTFANPLTIAKEWLQLTNARLAMEIMAKAEIEGETFILDQIDGRGHKISEFNGALSGICLPYFIDGALYGATPQEAYKVETGPQVNTEETLAAGELNAIVYVRMSPFAEMVSIEVNKVAITEVL